MVTRLFCTVILAISCGHLVHAFPIPHIPLSSLILQSDLIVEAKVGGMQERIVRSAHGTGSVATYRFITLDVHFVLLGDSQLRQIEVMAPPMDLICPAPAEFREGEVVLAFLRKTGSGIGFETCGLSYGTKYLDASSRKVYAERIAEFLIIKEIEKEAAREQEYLVWVARLTEDRATRLDGACILDNWNGRFIDGIPDSYKKLLTNRLLLLADFRHEDKALLSLVAKWDSARVISFLIKKLEPHDQQLRPCTDWMLRELMELRPLPEMEDLYNSFVNLKRVENALRARVYLILLRAQLKNEIDQDDLVRVVAILHSTNISNPLSNQVAIVRKVQALYARALGELRLPATSPPPP